MYFYLVYEKVKLKDELVGQTEKSVDEINLGSEDTLTLNLEKDANFAGKVTMGLHIAPPSGHFTSSLFIYLNIKILFLQFSNKQAENSRARMPTPDFNNLKRDFSGYVASDESVGDAESAGTGDKPKTVGDVMGGEDAPANFELGIELQRGINLKV